MLKLARVSKLSNVSMLKLAKSAPSIILHLFVEYSWYNNSFFDWGGFSWYCWLRQPVLWWHLQMYSLRCVNEIQVLRFLTSAVSVASLSWPVCLSFAYLFSQATRRRS